jgi:hypothetical protein
LKGQQEKDKLERMWKGCSNGLILRYNPIICLNGLRKTPKILSQYSWSLGRDLRPGLPSIFLVLTTDEKISNVGPVFSVTACASTVNASEIHSVTTFKAK